MIFCASSLSVLSTGIQTIAALLYPFSWQYIFVPVLPGSLLNFCCAPMPFVIGILSSNLPELKGMQDMMGDVYIFDLDEDVFVKHGQHKDVYDIPESYRNAMAHQVDVVIESPSSSLGTKLGKPFLAFFVQLFWNYKRFFDASNVFDVESFVSSKSSPASRKFLGLFSETQMFQMFLRDYEVGNTGGFATFERLTAYVEFQFAQAIKDLESSNPREKFRKRMSRILPFQTAAKRSSAVLQPKYATENSNNVEIIKKGQQSSFGIPLSTMSRKSGKAVAAMVVTPNTRENSVVPTSPLSPIQIKRSIRAAESPVLFSPPPTNEDRVFMTPVSVKEARSERFLSHFFETEARDVSQDTHDTSLATAEDPEESVALADDMRELALLIQESWTNFGPDDGEAAVSPLVYSPSSPYHCDGHIETFQPRNIAQSFVIEVESDVEEDEQTGVEQSFALQVDSFDYDDMGEEAEEAELTILGILLGSSN